MTDSRTISAGGVERRGAMREPQRGRDGPLAARRLAVETGTYAVSDACAAEEIWRPWQICVTADQPREFGLRRRHIRTLSVELDWDTFDSACRLRGLSPPDSLVFLVPLRLGPRSPWHRPTEKDQLPAVQPGGVDWVVDSGHSHLMPLAKYSLIRRRFGEEFCAALEGAASTHCVPAKPGEARRLDEWLSRLINDLDQRPEMLLRPEASDDLEEHRLQRLERTIDPARSEPQADCLRTAPRAGHCVGVSVCRGPASGDGRAACRDRRR